MFSSFNLADICIRLVTLNTWWVLSRHLEAAFDIGCKLDAMWYHLRSLAQRFGVRRMTARFMLYFLAVFIILKALLLMRSSLFSLVGMFNLCRNGLSPASLIVVVGTVVSSIRSVILAQIGLFGEKSRYVFSHIILMASFLAWISNIFRPPFSIGLCRTSRASLGEKSSSHMKSCIILIMAFSMCLGIPCTFARNWVCPPTITWIIFTLPIMVGFDFPHLPRFLCILSSVISHGAASLVLFSIQSPRDLIALPSSAILILGFSGSVSSWLTLPLTLTLRVFQTHDNF